MLPAFGVQMCVRNIGPSNPWLIYSVPLPSTLNFKMKQICCLPLFLSFLWRNLLFQGTQSFLGFLATASILPCHLQNILSILCQDTNDISRHQSSAWARRFHKMLLYECTRELENREWEMHLSLWPQKWACSKCEFWFHHQMENSVLVSW